MKDASPLVTLAVIAYNQQDVVHEAIAGALAQTYTPLEIILSDDCSPDDTFAVMQEMAAAYDGPHRVIARQTPRNMRLVPHLDDVVAMASGEFFVANAGDDVSAPDRVATLVAAWQSDDRIRLVHSAAHEIDQSGYPTGAIKRPPERVRNTPTGVDFIRDRGFVIGATAGWDRRVFDHFGPLGPDLSAEDRVIPFRASLLGKVAYVDVPLVGHRTGGVSSVSTVSDAWDYLYGISHKLRRWTVEIDRYVLKRFGDIDYPDKSAIEIVCAARAERMAFQVDLAEAGHLKRLCMAPQALRRAIADRSPRSIKHWLRYLFDGPYLTYARLRDRVYGRPPDTTGQAPDLLGRE